MGLHALSPVELDISNLQQSASSVVDINAREAPKVCMRATIAHTPLPTLKRAEGAAYHHEERRTVSDGDVVTQGV